MAEQTLIDVYQSRPDVQETVQKAFPGQDPLTQGTAANTWLNDWWNAAGSKENPNVTLIQPSQIAPQTPLNIQNPQPGPDLGAAMVAGVNNNLQSYINQLTPQQTQTQKDYFAGIEEVSGQLPALAGRSAAQLAKEEELGLPGMNKEQADIRGQIATKIAEYNRLFTKVEGEPITMDSIIGEQAQIKRAMESEIGMLSARDQALSGRISTAQATADRAIDLKYDTLEKEIEIKLKQIELLEPRLSQEEKITALAQQAMLEDQRQQIQDKKNLDKQIQSVLLTAVSNGAPANIQNAISRATTYEGAIQAAGSYLQERNTQIVGSADTGYYQIVTDAQGNVISKTLVTGGSGPKKDNPLSILDIQRYQESYPNAGVVAGDTEATANAKVASLNQPRDYTDEEIRGLVRDDKSQNKSYEEVISAIDSFPTLANKDRAKFIAAEIYGKANGKTFDEWMGKTQEPNSQNNTKLTPAGKGMYWTPDGRLISESQIGQYNQGLIDQITNELFTTRK